MQALSKIECLHDYQRTKSPLCAFSPHLPSLKKTCLFSVSRVPKQRSAMNGENGVICITTKGGHLDDEKIAGTETERTLLWQSDLRSDTNGTVDFSFIIPMSVKAIHFSIEGVSKNGEIVSYKKDIEVDEIK